MTRIYIVDIIYIWLANWQTGRLAITWTPLVYLRYRVVEWNQSTRDNGDVHHVPEVPHVGSRMENKTLVKNLKELFLFNEAVWGHPGSSRTLWVSLMTLILCPNLFQNTFLSPHRNNKQKNLFLPELGTTTLYRGLEKQGSAGGKQSTIILAQSQSKHKNKYSNIQNILFVVSQSFLWEK